MNQRGKDIKIFFIKFVIQRFPLVQRKPEAWNREWWCESSVTSAPQRNPRSPIHGECQLPFSAWCASFGLTATAQEGVRNWIKIFDAFSLRRNWIKHFRRLSWNCSRRTGGRRVYPPDGTEQSFDKSPSLRVDATEWRKRVWSLIIILNAWWHSIYTSFVILTIRLEIHVLLRNQS